MKDGKEGQKKAVRTEERGEIDGKWTREDGCIEGSAAVASLLGAKGFQGSFCDRRAPAIDTECASISRDTSSEAQTLLR